jgi:hypothetical protein
MLKTRLEHELKEVTDVFKGELDEVNSKLATSPPLHDPSRNPLLLPLLLSHNIPLPRLH